MTIIELPVSIGEAIDKLTILDIKYEKIKDKRKDEVKKEYDLLYEKLKDIVENYKMYYNIMKQINLDIWDMMDILRDSKNLSEEEYYLKCRECIEANDVRFRIKNKINFVSKSLLKEQKGYNVQRFIINLEKINEKINESIINPIKYYSFLFDEIIIKTNNNNKNILKEIFSYDPSIIIEETGINNYLEKEMVLESLNDVDVKLKITQEIKDKYFANFI